MTTKSWGGRWPWGYLQGTMVAPVDRYFCLQWTNSVSRVRGSLLEMGDYCKEMRDPSSRSLQQGEGVTLGNDSLSVVPLTGPLLPPGCSCFCPAVCTHDLSPCTRPGVATQACLLFKMAFHLLLAPLIAPLCWYSQLYFPEGRPG